MQSLSHVTSKVTITSLLSNVQEKELISAIMSAGCEYTKRCSSQFVVEHVMSVRVYNAELSHSELNIVVLGQLMAFMNNSSTVSIAGCHKEDEPNKAYTSLFHQGKLVCSRMFRFLMVLRICG